MKISSSGRDPHQCGSYSRFIVRKLSWMESFKTGGFERGGKRERVA